MRVASFSPSSFQETEFRSQKAIDESVEIHGYRGLLTPESWLLNSARQQKTPLSNLLKDGMNRGATLVGAQAPALPPPPPIR
jgi:hypothetical protein